MKSMTGEEKMKAAREVVAFAKSLGFKKASLAIWDSSDMESPCESLSEIVGGDTETEGEAELGVFFSCEPVKFVFHAAPITADNDDTVIEYLS